MGIYENWFAKYTGEIRNHLTNTSIQDSDPLTEWGWNFADLPAVLDEVDLKIEHTYRVRDHCKEIAKWLNLSNKDIQLASIIGLFHDLGRFRQALQFGTMDDRITGSHGEMSADIFLYDAPKEGLDDEEIDIITTALRYHNVFSLPALKNRQTLFTKLARDGDKLDIFYFYTNKNENRRFRFIMSEAQGDYSPSMLAGVLSGENLKVSGIKNQSDRKLMQVSLVYDLNFGYSFDWMLKKDYLAIITGVYDNTADDVMRKVYNFSTNWMKDKLK